MRGLRRQRLIDVVNRPSVTEPSELVAVIVIVPLPVAAGRAADNPRGRVEVDAIGYVQTAE